jgi:hypothetical protein
VANYSHVPNLSILHNVPKFPSHLFFSQNLEYGYLLAIHISPETQESNRRHNENMNGGGGEDYLH